MEIDIGVQIKVGSIFNIYYAIYSSFRLLDAAFTNHIHLLAVHLHGSPIIVVKPEEPQTTWPSNRP